MCYDNAAEENKRMKKTKNRKHVSICGFAALTALAVLFASISAHAAEAALAARFKYDDSKPLNARWAGLQGNPYYNLYKVIYDSGNGEKVPALYMEPKAAKRPFPCVILQHGYGGSKDNAKTMGGFDMAKAGYAVFAIDAQYHGERRKPGKDMFSPDIEADAAAMVQTVIDLRRAVDLLQSREGVDPQRITYLGVSMGAILGSIVSGVEPRIQAPALVVGGGDWKTLLAESRIGPAKTIRTRIEKGQMGDIDEIAAELSYLEPLNFIGSISPRPVLMINTKHDTIVPTSTNKLLHQKAREPKKVVWLDGVPGDPTGHIPPLKEMIELALEWWEKNL
mgnify:CR=1 FL=1